MSEFGEVFMALIAFMLIFMAIAISCRVIELIWMAIFACFSPLMCPNRRREPWPAELCNLLIISIICIDNTLYKCCFTWCDSSFYKVFNK